MEAVLGHDVGTALHALMNAVADKLSRFAPTDAPGVALPAVLNGATRWIPPPRDDSYFRTLSPPAP